MFVMIVLQRMWWLYGIECDDCIAEDVMIVWQRMWWLYSRGCRGVIWGGWGAVAPQGKEKKKEKKEKREKKKKKEKKKERELWITWKLPHIKCCFFKFFSSPVALKIKKNFGPPRKSWNDAPERMWWLYGRGCDDCLAENVTIVWQRMWWLYGRGCNDCDGQRTVMIVWQRMWWLSIRSSPTVPYMSHKWGVLEIHILAPMLSLDCFAMRYKSTKHLEFMPYMSTHLRGNSLCHIAHHTLDPNL